jgi:hypothetical protein
MSTSFIVFARKTAYSLRFARKKAAFAGGIGAIFGSDDEISRTALKAWGAR